MSHGFTYQIETDLTAESLINELQKLFENSSFIESTRFDEFYGFDGKWRDYEIALIFQNDKKRGDNIQYQLQFISILKPIPVSLKDEVHGKLKLIPNLRIEFLG